MQVFGKIVAIVVMLMILAGLGFRFLGSMEQVSAQGLKIEHTRLLNVLAMVRSQWLTQGRPKQMRLDWSITLARGDGEQSMVLMSQQGWPTLMQVDEINCKVLWEQLLGAGDGLSQLVTIKANNGEVCSYIASNGDRLSYQLSSGRVIFLTDD